MNTRQFRNDLLSTALRTKLKDASAEDLARYTIKYGKDFVEKNMPSNQKKASCSLREAMLKTAKKDMPSFLKQDRPKKVKEIYRALKRDHPDMPAEVKARIAARQGKPGKQHQGPPYKAPITKTAYVTAAVTGGGNNSVLNWNDSGGLMPVNEEDRQRAGAVNLKTLPMDVEGANCATCKYFKITDEGQGLGICQEPDVRQDVTVRMLCYAWENPGTIPVVSDEEKESEGMQADEESQDMEADAAMAEGGMPSEAPAPQQPQGQGGQNTKEPAPQKTASLMELVSTWL